MKHWTNSGEVIEYTPRGKILYKITAALLGLDRRGEALDKLR
jgi:hypothetical protein